jgi:hypothetical protein
LREEFVHEREVLENLRDGPLVGSGTLAAFVSGHGLDGRTECLAARLEWSQDAVNMRMHRVDLSRGGYVWSSAAGVCRRRALKDGD